MVRFIVMTELLNKEVFIISLKACGVTMLRKFFNEVNPMQEKRYKISEVAARIGISPKGT